LVRSPFSSGPFDTMTGKPEFTHRMKCPRSRWFNIGHDSYIVRSDGIYYDEEWM